MIILNESQTILSTAVLHRNKLTGMRNQLENLLKKKIRLETEIAKLKISIKKNSKSLDLKTRTKISLEAFQGPDGPLTSEAEELIQEEIPELVPILVSIDQIQQEIDDLIQEIDQE